MLNSVRFVNIIIILVLTLVFCSMSCGNNVSETDGEPVVAPIIQKAQPNLQACVENKKAPSVAARPDTGYYIDASNGDDQNDGLSPQTAWKTISKVNASVFEPGEYILFKRDEVWSDIKLEVSSSGKATLPITYGAYGEGNKPIIEVAWEHDNAVVLSANDYITFQNLEIKGGFASVGVYGSDFTVIEDCMINSGFNGIWISQKDWDPIVTASNHGIVRRCMINSGYGSGKNYPEDGIHLRNGANHWQIYDNEIRDWGHSSINLLQYDADTNVSYNQIFCNLIAGENTPYVRGFDMQGMEDGCQYNEFCCNIIRNTSVKSQLGGDHNTICYNIIDTVKNSSYVDWETGY